MSSWARKVDTTHGPIADTLRRCGWQVEHVHRLAGFCDLVAWRHGQIDTVRLIECKTGKGRHTEAQAKLLARGCPVVTLRSVDDAIALR